MTNCLKHHYEFNVKTYLMDFSPLQWLFLMLLSIPSLFNTLYFDHTLSPPLSPYKFLLFLPTHPTQCSFLFTGWLINGPSVLPYPPNSMLFLFIGWLINGLLAHQFFWHDASSCWQHFFALRTTRCSVTMRTSHSKSIILSPRGLDAFIEKWFWGHII